MTRIVILLTVLASSASALLPRAACLSQCAATIQADCLNRRGHVKPACKRKLIRQCRHHKPVCTTTTTTTTSTTTTSTSTTSTSTSSTTSTTGIEGGAHFTLTFTNGLPGGACGEIDGPAGKIRDLTCGGLNIGGGASTVQEGPTPDGSTNVFRLDCATASEALCTITPVATPPAPHSLDPDCTDVGCNFGTPLPIPNPALPNLTTCVQNTWAEPASGTLDRSTGESATATPLASDIYITGNVNQPCPVCRGLCDRGVNAGLACVSANSHGLTRDCPTGGTRVSPGCGTQMTCDCEAGVNGHDSCVDGTHVGIIAVTLSPLTTGDAMATASDGKFCPAQGGTPGSPGCFNAPGCTTIIEHGAPAGAITVSTPATARLASVFCIAATPNGLVN